jgi:hypothetical protein
MIGRLVGGRQGALLLGCALAALLGGCGGGGGSSSAPAPQRPPQGGNPPPPSASFSLGGTAVKGIIRNASVEVADAGDASVVVGTGSTTPSGRYDIEVTDTSFTGPFVRVIVRGDADATMICDAAEGCGDGAAFGEPFPIGPDFSLSAIVPTPGDEGSASVNVNLLTDLSAALAASGGAPDADDIAAANAQVAAAFGLGSTPLTELPALDLTAGAPAEADEDAVRAAILAAGVLGAAFEDAGASATAGELMRKLAEDFAREGGQLVKREAEDTGRLTLEEILRAAIEVSETPGIKASRAAADLSAALAGEFADAAAAPAGSRTNAKPSPNRGASSLAKAKAFVTDLQTVVQAVELDANADVLEAFADDAEAAAEIVGDQTEDIAARIIPAVVEAGYEAVSAVDFDLYTGLFVIPTDIGELTFNAVEEGDGVRMVLDQTLEGGYEADLSFLLPKLPDEIVNEEDGVIRGVIETSLVAELTGEVRGQGVALTIHRGRLNLVEGMKEELDETEILNGGAEIYRTVTALRAARLALDLDAGVEKLGGEPFTFEGSLSFELAGLEFREEEQSRIGGSTVAPPFRLYSAQGSLASTSLALSGTFSNQTNSIGLTATLDLVSPDRASISNTPTLVKVGEQTFADDKVSIMYGDVDGGYGGPVFGITAELITASEVEAEIEAEGYRFAQTTTSEAREEGHSDVVWDFYYYPPQDPRYGRHIISAVSDTEKPVLREEFVGEVFDWGLFFNQIETQWIFPGFVDTNELERTPSLTDVVDYYATVSDRDDGYYRVCLYDQLHVSQPFAMSAAGADIEGYETGVLVLCDQEAQFRQFLSFDLEGRGPAFDLEGSRLRASVSVRQDLVGLDPADPGVELRAFGSFDYKEGEIVGRPSVQLNFAGRRFSMTASTLEALADLSAFDPGRGEPVTVRNQDGVVLTLTETDGVLGGTLKIGEEVLGTVSEGAGAVPVVTFTDNSFVSFN